MNLIGQSTADLENCACSWGEASFRGRQLAEWIYRKSATSFEEMTNLSQGLRSKLATDASLDFPTIVDSTQARDGTSKLLLALSDGERIETVRLPYPERLSVCISSQAGCAMACQFCATGMGGFRRNLTVAEIISQVLLAQRAGADQRRPSHIVFMGMGEPLLNLNNVLKSIGLLHDEMGIPMRQITVSTVGIVPGIEKLAEAKLQLTLAISLHAPSDELRHRLIPTSTKTSVQDIVEAGKNYVSATGRRITFEYVVLGGINDSAVQARQLAKLCKGWPCHVNLIPWNDVPGASLEGALFHAPQAGDLREFKRILESSGITITQRLQRGADVAAACGQLRAIATTAAPRQNIVAPDSIRFVKASS